MKQLVLNCSLLLGLSACGYNPPLDQCVWDGTKCEHREPIKGEKGDTGSTGSQGPRGDQGIPGQSGKDGTDGSNGADGKDGKDGSSCTATQTSNGAIISCTDGTSVVILNGTDGEDGEDAPPTAYSVVEIKDVCGDQSGFDEVLLKLGNGKWLAHFSGSGNNFLTILTPGTYRTTDGTSCHFTVNSNGTITGEHN